MEKEDYNYILKLSWICSIIGLILGAVLGIIIGVQLK